MKQARGYLIGLIHVTLVAFISMRTNANVIRINWIR